MKKLIGYLFVAIIGISNLQAQDGVSFADSLTHKTTKIKKERPWTVAPYSVSLGAFFALSNTRLGAGIDNKAYGVYDFENDLGLSQDTYSMMLNLRTYFKSHNRVDLSYYRIYRNAEATLQKDIEFGEHVYPANASVSVFLNTNIIRLSYGYSFISNKRLEVGALVGFHVLSFNVGLDLVGNTVQKSFEDDVKFTAPLPDFGFWGTYAFNDRWATSAEISYFSLKYNNTKGRILNGNVVVQYKINKHWHADLGYTGFGVKVNLDRERLKSDFNWNYSGPTLVATYKFGSL